MTEEEKAKRLAELKADMDRASAEQRDAAPWAVAAARDSAHDVGIAFMRGNVSFGRGMYDVSKFAAKHALGPFTGTIAAQALAYGASSVAKAAGAGDDTVGSVMDLPGRVDSKVNSLFDTAEAFWQYKTPWMKESPKVRAAAEFVLPMATSLGTSAARTPTVTKVADAVAIPAKGTLATGKAVVSGTVKAAKKLTGSSGYTGTTVADLMGAPKSVEGGKAAHWFGSTDSVRAARSRVTELKRTLPGAGARTAEQTKTLDLATATYKAEVEAAKRTRNVRRVARLEVEPFIESAFRKTRLSKDAGPLSRATVSGVKRGFLQYVGNSGETYAQKKQRLDAERDAVRKVYRDSLNELRGRTKVGPDVSASDLAPAYRSAKSAIKAFRESRDPDPSGTRTKDADAQESALLKAIMAHPQFSAAVSNQLQTVTMPNKLGFVPGVDYTPGMRITRGEKDYTTKASELFDALAKDPSLYVDRIFMEERNGKSR